MSEKQLLYWIGKGSVMHDGKPLDKNVPLPLEKLTKEFIEKHTKLGNIGEKIVSREALTNAELERIARENTELKKTVKDLEKKVSELSAENEKLQKAVKKGGER